MQREFSTLAQLDHPNIINYVESFSDAKGMMIVTDYIEDSADLEKLLFR